MVVLVGDQDLEGILVDAELAVVKGFQVEEKLDPVFNSAADRGGLRIRQDPQAGCRGTLTMTMIMMISLMTMMNPSQAPSYSSRITLLELLYQPISEPGS